MGGNQADIRTMVDLGVSWARYDINQSQTLAASDVFVYPTLAAGIHVLGILMPSSTDPAGNASWARTVVEHYAPQGVHVWEWRNESNWARTNVPVATYTAELKAAYTAIDEVDPSATVLTGGSVRAAQPRPRHTLRRSTTMAARVSSMGSRITRTTAGRAS